MCGIFGFLKLKNTDDKWKEASSLLKHRGPDKTGFFENTSVYLSHHRLSIIDLSSGHQPMPNEDRNIWCVYNGEIYNFKELREYLQERGHVFSTRSDTEVIVHLYEEHGRDCVSQLNGMFAFAIWDEKKQSLFCARDRLGIKPFYYAETEDAFFFSSEIKALHSLKSIPDDIHLEAFFQFLFFRYITGPRTIFSRIMELEPAHTLTITRQKKELYRYWRPPEACQAFQKDDKTDELEHALRESVRKRLVSDVPFGIFLSGGLDSSLILSYMADYLGKGIQAFNISFDVGPFDESPYARHAARLFGAELHTFTFTSNELMNTLIPALSHFDQPFADEAAVPTYLLSRETKKHVKMVLAGEGGDELFMGYNSYLALQNNLILDRFIRFLPRGLLKKGGTFAHSASKLFRLIGKAMKNSGRPHFEVFYTWISPSIPVYDIIKPELHQALNMCSLWKDLEAVFQQGEPLSSARLFDLTHYLPYNLLKKVDMMSMAFGLEARVPFLDHSLAEKVLAIPAKEHLRQFSGKRILKKIASKRLPGSLVKRKKHGFSVPVGLWFRNELRERLCDTLMSQGTLTHDYFNQKAIQKMLDEHISQEKDYSRALWMLFCLETWHQRINDR